MESILPAACPALARYSFVKLNEMESMEPNKIIDVIAVVKGFEDCATIMTK